MGLTVCRWLIFYQSQPLQLFLLQTQQLVAFDAQTQKSKPEKLVKTQTCRMGMAVLPLASSKLTKLGSVSRSLPSRALTVETD